MGYVPPHAPTAARVMMLPNGHDYRSYGNYWVLTCPGSCRKPEGFMLNLDRFGMPRDYATYVWLLYGKRVEDRSPARLAFLGWDPRRQSQW